MTLRLGDDSDRVSGLVVSMTLKAQISVQNVKTKLISDFLKLSTYMVKPEVQEVQFSDFMRFKVIVMSRN